MLLYELYDNLLCRYYIVEDSIPLTLNSRNYDLFILILSVLHYFFLLSLIKNFIDQINIILQKYFE